MNIDNHFLLPAISPRAIYVLLAFDIVILTIQCVEYFLRVWSCKCKSKYRGWWGSVRFLLAPFRIIDMFVIACSVIVLVEDCLSSPVHDNVYWLRFFQVFQSLRMETRFHPWRTMMDIIWQQRRHMFIVSYTCFLVYLLMVFVVYFCERDHPETSFTSLADSLYWGVVTMTSIGYGDISPSTTAGRILTSLLAIFGVILFTLPGSLIGTGLALKVDENNRLKHNRKKRNPAAVLIQATWRLYSVEQPELTATWTAHMARIAAKRQAKLNPSHASTLNLSSMFSSSKHHHHPASSTSAKFKFDNPPPSSPTFSLFDTVSRNNSPSPGVHTPTPTISDVHLNCLRFVHKLQWQVARKRFKNTLKPYGIQDVIEEYSQGQAEVLAKVRAMQTQINTVHYDLSRTIKLVQNLHYNQSVQMASVERGLRELTEQMVDFQIVNYRHFSRHSTARRDGRRYASSSHLPPRDDDDQDDDGQHQTEPYVKIFVRRENVPTTPTTTTLLAPPKGKSKNGPPSPRPPD